MYEAWNPPLDARSGMTSRILLKVDRTGLISQVSLASSSGNPQMDASALDAARHVTKLPPLPSEIPGNPADITVNFKLP